MTVKNFKELVSKEYIEFLQYFDDAGHQNALNLGNKSFDLMFMFDNWNKVENNAFYYTELPSEWNIQKTKDFKQDDFDKLFVNNNGVDKIVIPTKDIDEMQINNFEDLKPYFVYPKTHLNLKNIPNEIYVDDYDDYMKNIPKNVLIDLCITENCYEVTTSIMNECIKAENGPKLIDINYQTFCQLGEAFSYYDDVQFKSVKQLKITDIKKYDQNLFNFVQRIKQFTDIVLNFYYTIKLSDLDKYRPLLNYEHGKVAFEINYRNILLNEVKYASAFGAITPSF